MPNKISKNYYPASQKFFQDLLSKFSPLLSLVLSNWVKRLIPPRWFSPLPIPFCTALSPASRDSWDKTSGPSKRLQKLLWSSSFIPCESKPTLSCFLSLMIPLLKRVARRFRDALGTKIMLKTWPMFLVTNGYFRPCFIKIFSCPFGPSSIIPKERRAVHAFRPRLRWPKGLSKDSDFLFLVNSMCWRIVGTGPKPWPTSVGSVVTI